MVSSTGCIGLAVPVAKSSGATGGGALAAWGAHFRTPAGNTTVERTCGIAVPTLAATVTSLVSGDDSGNGNNQNRPNNQNQNDGNGQGDGQQPNDPQPTPTPEADPIPENPTTRQYGSEFQRWSEAIKKHQQDEISDADRKAATDPWKQVRCKRGWPEDQHYC